MPQLWYGFNNHFSSATIYDPWIYQLYNVVFTSFPIIVYAIFDEQHSKEMSMKEPHLYNVGLKNELFNVKAIAFWFASPIFYACVLAYVNYFSLEESLDTSGQMFDMMGCGMAIFVECIIISNLKILVISYTPTIGLKMLVAIGIGFFYLCSWVAELIFPFGDMKNTLKAQLKSINYWSVILACVSFVMIIEVIMNRYERFM